MKLYRHATARSILSKKAPNDINNGRDAGNVAPVKLAIGDFLPAWLATLRFIAGKLPPIPSLTGNRLTTSLRKVVVAVRFSRSKAQRSEP
ncbi:MAG: hypothetical protein IIB77_10415 [Proteobacteria bacterium]|nr:hypothetical protein [Pseudomonadota bacterium]